MQNCDTYDPSSIFTQSGNTFARPLDFARVARLIVYAYVPRPQYSAMTGKSRVAECRELITVARGRFSGVYDLHERRSCLESGCPLPTAVVDLNGGRALCNQRSWCEGLLAPDLAASLLTSRARAFGIRMSAGPAHPACDAVAEPFPNVVASDNCTE